MSKRLGGIKGCKYKTSSWHLNRFPDADNMFEENVCVLALAHLSFLRPLLAKVSFGLLGYFLLRFISVCFFLRPRSRFDLVPSIL